MTGGAQPLAAIFGCAGPRPTARERDFFRDADPVGFILFARNIETPDQVRALIGELREAVGRADAPVLVDQEGGRVQRLRAPHWREAPPAGDIAALHAVDPAAGRKACAINADLMAAELAELGFTVDCLPVLDIPQSDADPVIGDRAVGRTPVQSAELGRIVCDRMLAQGVTPVIKHLPGHGRATVDSHHALPVVDTPREALGEVDFAPFRELSAGIGDQVWGMTAHVVYSAIDADAPATTSAAVIGEIIRGDIGFGGFLVSDDLSMKALAGTPSARAEASIAAGCDAVLHCNGAFDEMTAVAATAGRLSSAGAARLKAAETERLARRARVDIDREAGDAAVRRLLGDRAA